MAFPASSAYKAQAVAAELADALKKWAFTVAQSFDTDGFPIVTATAGTLVAGQQCALMKVLPLPNIGTDALGLSQTSWVPLKIQLVEEATAANADTSLVKVLNNAKIVGETLKWGTIVEFWLTANGQAVRVPLVGTDVLEATWQGNSLQYGQLAAS